MPEVDKRIIAGKAIGQIGFKGLTSIRTPTHTKYIYMVIGEGPGQENMGNGMLYFAQKG